MALTSAEKQRRYRQKRDQDVQKREEYLQKGRQRWMQYKASGKVKAISEKSPREQRQQRKAWRHSQRASRARKKDQQAQLTPPTSPVEGIPQPAMHSRQHIQGRKKVKKDRAACYRANQKLELLVQQQKRKLEMYKKRYSRLKNKITPSDADSPRTKTRKLLRHQQVNVNVRRTLDYHHALVRSLKTQFNNCQKQNDRYVVAHVVMNNITKRYRKIAQSSTGFSRRWEASKKHTSPGLPRQHRAASKMAEKLKHQVKMFYIRDDVSRSTTGKKETKTKNKQKEQKRLLSDSMYNLHKKCLSEYQGRISYSLFCRLRPYWFMIPSAADKNTCQCKLHENLAFKANRMKQINLANTENLEELVAKVVCHVDNKECMYGECILCKDTPLPITYADEVTAQDEIWW